ncbi:Glutamyl-tRNA reductase [Candidatus Hydrogenisulfobacillus filiaventi]|uniref:Glutamyl-tRNA reductase n=1 Tax=Candidatus Hydrogenisulfobacillus filiaventi TaxID=2707344 RepID=A0A6F8ZER1_9FIRM|nr:glutamyl-tRNA reductase [Bacillota bacterium]CAB1128358.1 Glutamyl-tRNA reductase [Candidatus Hydrogenisulfobacillus filiaventi]
MRIQVVGLNHETAPVEVREVAGFTPDSLRAGLATIGGLPGLEGAVVVSTCNRTEVYTAGEVALADILSWWERTTGTPRGTFSDHLYWYRDTAAIEHLFRVATGLDSMVLGETQILGQVKDAYQAARLAGVAGGLHRVFHHAFAVGKRAHTETGISQNALSVGHAVVELARKVFGELTDTAVLVVGAGETGQLVTRHLVAAGARRITIVNRTAAKARELADELGARAVPWTALGEALRESDIVVSSTSAPEPVITPALMRAATRGQEERFRFLFDLAVPRDIDPAVVRLGRGIFLYDIDDLDSVVEANRQYRRKEAVKVERIIQEETARLQEELGAAEVAPVIRSLRAKAESIRRQELDRVYAKLPGLGERERAVVDEALRLVVNKLLNDPMVSLRRWGQSEEGAVYLAAVSELFRLQPEDGKAAAARPEAAATLAPEGGRP